MGEPPRGESAITLDQHHRDKDREVSEGARKYPDINGFEVTRLLKQDDHTKTIEGVRYFV
jgi:hypothetical protein